MGRCRWVNGGFVKESVQVGDRGLVDGSLQVGDGRLVDGSV